MTLLRSRKRDETTPFEWPAQKRGALTSDQRDDCISHHLDLVKIAAGRIAGLLPRRYEAEDCHAAGALALIRAVDEYDPTRGIPFKAYAYPRIYGAIIDMVRSQEWVPRNVRKDAKRLRDAYSEVAGRLGYAPDDQQVAEYLGLNMEEFDALVQRSSPALLLSLESLTANEYDQSRRDTIPDTDHEPIDDVALKEELDLMTRAVDHLNDDEKKVILLHYTEGLMFKEIAVILKLSRARISQLHTKALCRLKAQLENS